jgi:hypothetical protein
MAKLVLHKERKHFMVPGGLEVTNCGKNRIYYGPDINKPDGFIEPGETKVVRKTYDVWCPDPSGSEMRILEQE